MNGGIINVSGLVVVDNLNGTYTISGGALTATTFENVKL